MVRRRRQRRIAVVSLRTLARGFDGLQLRRIHNTKGRKMTLNEAHAKLIDMSKRNIFSESKRRRIELALKALDFVKHMVNPNSPLTASCELELVKEMTSPMCLIFMENKPSKDNR